MGNFLKIALLLILTMNFTSCTNQKFKELMLGEQGDPNFISSMRVTEQYTVFVDSINDGESHKKQKYVILPGLKGITENNLQFKEYSSYIHRAMKKAGYIQATTGSDADIGVLFAYGIGEAEKETSYSTSSYATTVPAYYNYSTFSTTKIKANTKVNYTRNMILDAYDYAYFKKTGKEKPIWRTEVISRGARADLRVVLPVMIATATPHIGSNTGKQLKFIVGTPSKELYEILGKPIPSK